MTYSTSRENYLKAIYHLQGESSLVTTNELAKELRTRAASVTDMLKKLRAQDLLHYERYKGFRLSDKGNQVAVQIIRKHRLWEYFLVEKLHFGWEEVHEVAEELEHISSKELVDRLDEFLGFPRRDPHGDPIPNREGNFPSRRDICLCDLPAGSSTTVTNIADQSAGMLELLTHRQIAIGSKIQVLRCFDFDQSMEVRIEDLPPVVLSAQVSRQIYVQG